MKSNKLDFKNIIICILSTIIILGGIHFINYHQNVNRVINYNIHTNLLETKFLLSSLDNTLSNYENHKINKEEFQYLLLECQSNLVLNIYSTAEYSHISERLEYLNIKNLVCYIRNLSIEQFSDDKELEFHKKNILEICKLWREVNIELSDNYFLPSRKLKETLIKTQNLSEKGYNRLYEDEEL